MAHLSELLGKRPAVVNILGPEDRVAEAVRIMAERRVGAVLVCDGGRLVGIFSERDLLRRVVAAGHDPAATPLRDVMTREPATAAPEDSSARAIAKMRVVGCRHLPILQGDHVVDTISIRDLLFRELEARDGDIEELRRYIHGDSPDPASGGGA
jgi:predicted transcriptional regulator